MEMYWFVVVTLRSQGKLKVSNLSNLSSSSSP